MASDGLALCIVSGWSDSLGHKDVRLMPFDQIGRPCMAMKRRRADDLALLDVWPRPSGGRAHQCPASGV